MNRLSFTIFLIFFFVQKNFNFVLNKLLNPSIFALASETILEHFFPEWFAQSVHACLTSETILKCFCSEELLILTSENILEYFCPERFTQSDRTCFVLRNYFRIFLSRRVYSIHSDRTCLEGLLNPFMIYFLLKNLFNH